MNGKHRVVSALSRLLRARRPYFILAGAGISIDSGRPAAQFFMSTLLERIGSGLHSGPLTSRLRQLVNQVRRDRRDDYDFLRFEWLLQNLRDYYDEALDVVSIYGDPVAPNHNHYVLASLLGSGHVVCTTNFDSLIEDACQDLGIPFTQVYRDEHFRRWLEAPHAFMNPLFKIHGTLYEYRDGRKVLAADSLKATLDQVGLQGLEFSSEVGKAAFFTRMLARHDTLVLGYSGGDDFDICPTIERQESTRRMFWIDHRWGRWMLRRPVDLGRRRVADRPSCERLLLKLVAGPTAPRRSNRLFLLRMPTRDAMEVLAAGQGVAPPPQTRSQAAQGKSRASAHLTAWAARYLGDAPWKSFHLAGELFRYFELLAEFRECARRGRTLVRRRDHAGRAMTGYLHCWSLWGQDRHREGAQLCERLLASAPSTVSLHFLKGLANIHYLYVEHLSLLGEAGRARRASRRALAFLDLQIQRSPGDPFFRKVKADLLSTLGNMNLSLGSIDRSRRLFEESLALYRAIGDIYGVRRRDRAVAIVPACDPSILDSARALYDESVALCTIIGYRWDAGQCLVGQADVARPRGAIDEALRLLSEAEAIFSSSEDLRELATAYRAKADLHRLNGRLAAASALYRKADRLYVRAEAKRERVSVALGLADIQRLRASRQEAQAAFDGARRAARRLGARLEHAHALLGLAALGTRGRRHLVAAHRIYSDEGCAWGAQEALRLSLQAPSPIRPGVAASGLDFVCLG